MVASILLLTMGALSPQKPLDIYDSIRWQDAFRSKMIGQEVASRRTYRDEVRRWQPTATYSAETYRVRGSMWSVTVRRGPSSFAFSQNAVTGTRASEDDDEIRIDLRRFASEEHREVLEQAIMATLTNVRLDIKCSEESLLWDYAFVAEDECVDVVASLPIKNMRSEKGIAFRMALGSGDFVSVSASWPVVRYHDGEVMVPEQDARSRGSVVLRALNPAIKDEDVQLYGPMLGASAAMFAPSLFSEGSQRMVDVKNGKWTLYYVVYASQPYLGNGKWLSCYVDALTGNCVEGYHPVIESEVKMSRLRFTLPPDSQQPS